MSDHVERLRQLLAVDAEGARTLLTVPGCWDALSALLIDLAGFPVGFVSGGAVSMARFGRADMGLVTATEAIDTIAAIRDRVAMPLIADGDTGFGNALNLQRTVRGFERAGASAIQIEDQGFPKRCGHMNGKSVVPLAEAVGRVKAALDARHDMLVIARTDALAIEGPERALERADAYLAAGADLIFVEGPRSIKELESIAGRFSRRVPLIHNLVEGGVSPTRSGSMLAELGFAVALHPLLLLHGFVRHAPDWLSRLKAERSTASLDHALVTLDDMNALLGAQNLIDLGRRYGGHD